MAVTDRFLIMESGIKWSLCTTVTLNSEECAGEVKDVLDSKVLPYLVEVTSILILYIKKLVSWFDSRFLEH